MSDLLEQAKVELVAAFRAKLDAVSTEDKKRTQAEFKVAERRYAATAICTVVPDFNIYADGICCMSVCVSSSNTREQIEARANFDNPTGIASVWRIADGPFLTGEPNPHPCERNRQTHQHYLLEC